MPAILSAIITLAKCGSGRDVPTSWPALARSGGHLLGGAAACNPASSLAIRGLACGEQDGRLADQAVPLGWLEACVVEQAEVGRQLVDPAAGCA